MTERATTPASFASEQLDIQRHRQLTALLFAAVIGIEVSVGFFAHALFGAALLAVTVTLAAVVLRGQWLVARERELAKEAYAREKVQEVYRDPLTGLPNRAQVIEDLAREIARAERFGDALTMAVVEVNRYDDLVAAWGQETANAAISHVADTLRRVTRASDLCARTDENRFAIALVKCDLAAADNFAEHVRLAISNRPLRTGGRLPVPVYLEVSVATLEYRPGRYRGPLEYLSAAGGDIQLPDQAERRVVGTERARDSLRGLRTQLVAPARRPLEREPKRTLWRAS